MTDHRFHGDQRCQPARHRHSQLVLGKSRMRAAPRKNPSRGDATGSFGRLRNKERIRSMKSGWRMWRLR